MDLSVAEVNSQEIGGLGLRIPRPREVSVVGGLKISRVRILWGLWSLPGRRATFFAGCLLVQPEVQFELKFSRLVGAMFGAIRKRTPRILHRTWRTGTS